MGKQKQTNFWQLLFALIATLVAVLVARQGFDSNRPGSIPGFGDGTPGSGTARPVDQPGTYQLCFWNVENLFDDSDDNRKSQGDVSYDPWFARDGAAREQKLANLASVLLSLNDNRGPDILCVAEIESARAADLLRLALNSRLKEPKLHYPYSVYRNPGGGRHIATALISRLPVDQADTTLLGRSSRHRTLETFITINQHTLVVVATHWTSKLSDKTGDQRAKYGDVIQGTFRGMYKRNPQVDFLVCGDLNDDPTDPSVTNHLRAIGDLAQVKEATNPPYLLNLMAPLWAVGQYSWADGRKKNLFDQICISPGLLDEVGWSCDPASVRIVKKIANRSGNPDRFGSENDRRPLDQRGASDHFPVTVELKVR